MSDENFIAACLVGDALATEIDDFIDAWHDGQTDLALHEFLGMSHDEYKLWLERPASLDLIITAHKEGRSVFET